MPFTLSLTFDWLRHRLVAAKGALYGRKSDYFVKDTVNLTTLTKPDGTPLLCPICGFAMAELMLSQGWSVKACSANGFKNIIGNAEFDSWQKDVIDKQQANEAAVNNNLSISSK